MERLTVKQSDGRWTLNLATYDIVVPSRIVEKFSIAITRLAAYEDTGMEPEEIKALILPPKNPLTLEELREMDGEPVYLDFGKPGGWALVRLMGEKVFFVHKNGMCSPSKIAFAYGCKIFCRKPEGAGNES